MADANKEVIDFAFDKYVEPYHGEWQIIPVAALKTEAQQKVAHRLNALGSFYYFAKIVLRNRRFTENLHLDLCRTLEKEHLKEVIEVPRDHFKSTVYSESAPMWWALPFTKRDEELMRSLGYGDAWIRWMRRAHNQDTRTLLVSENITNAAKLGVRIDGHYQNNVMFRYIFPDCIPDNSSWTQFSKTHKRTTGAKPHGEGTFDYIGVGGALQSRHYDRVIQDDLVGKGATESDVTMEKTIEYHKLLVGAFDSDRTVALDNDEIVVGNRWSWKDLNSYIRKNEPYFHITNHSALGGCCNKHAKGVPIFPEEFTLQKLERFSKRLGTYLFSCQFLNQPTNPDSSAFDAKYLRFYKWGRALDEGNVQRTVIQHEVEDGEVLENVPVSHLRIVMVVDPNHSGESGRCNHAITVVGVGQGKDDKGKDLDNIYLLECWAESTSYDAFISKIYELAEKFKLSEFWLETIAAQKYLKYHLEYRNRIEGRKLKIRELKTPRSANAKDTRIKALGPTFENRSFWCRRTDTGFIEEYTQYPFGKMRDILDTLGYSLELWGTGWSKADMNDYIANYNPSIGAGKCGY